MSLIFFPGIHFNFGANKKPLALIEKSQIYSRKDAS